MSFQHKVKLLIMTEVGVAEDTEKDNNKENV